MEADREDCYTPRVSLVRHSEDFVPGQGTARTCIIGPTADLEPTADRLAGASGSAAEVRIVVPACHAERTIRACVVAIGQSSLSLSWETVVVDDGGHEDLGLTLRSLPARIVPTGGSGSAAVARNAGARGFAGRYLVFVDADVLVHPDCLERLLAPLRAGRAEAAVGNYSRDVTGLGFAARYKQLYIAHIYARRGGFLRNDFWTAIGAIDATIFRSLGGFDTGFRGANGEDAELGHRLTRRGCRIAAVPEALGDHRPRLDLVSLCVNDWRKGSLAVHQRWCHGSPLSENRHATLRDKLAVVLCYLAIVSCLWLALPGAPLAPALSLSFACLLAYGMARADVGAAFRGQGRWFRARAAVVMFLLDFIRGGCLATGTLWYLRTLATGPRPSTTRVVAASRTRLT
jgi:hypothetical protein